MKKKITFFTLFILSTFLNAENAYLNIEFDEQSYRTNSFGYTLETEQKTDGVIKNNTNEEIYSLFSDISNPNYEGLCSHPKFASSSFIISNLNISKDSFTVFYNVKFNNNFSNKKSVLMEIYSKEGNKLAEISTARLNYSTQNGIYFGVANSDGSWGRGVSTSELFFSPYQWYHLTFVFDGINGKMQIYLDGKIAKEVAITKGSLPSNGFEIYIGNSKDNAADYIEREIDEIKIFNSAVTEGDIVRIETNEQKYLDYLGSTKSCETKTCYITSTEEFDPIGDIFGKLVFTKKVLHFKCDVLVEKRGACKIVSKDVDFILPEQEIGGAIIRSEAGGSIGEIAAISSASSALNGMMSGWKGYCVKGLDEDFDWVSDPMVWSSYALTAIGGELSSANKTIQDAATSAAQRAGEVAASSDTFTSQVLGDYANNILLEAAKIDMYNRLAQMGLCATQAGLDLYAIANSSDEIPCDPVDEFCDEDDNKNGFDDQIYPITKQEYEDAIKANPKYADMMVIDHEEDDIVFVKIVYPKNQDMSENFDEAQKEMQEEMKKLQYIMLGISTTSCMVSAGFTGTITTSSTAEKSSSEKTSTTQIANSTASLMGNLLCGPICSIGLSVATRIATSFKKVNSCEDEDDAQTKGSRHESTQKALKSNLCRITRTECVIDAKFGGGCQLKGYHYCCYDTIQTKLIAEEIKAQLASDWTHCTGISMNEFVNVSFKSCSKEDIADGVDGKTIPYGSTLEERQQAYQYKHKCIDYTNYINYLTKLTGLRYDEEDIKKMIEEQNSY